MARLGRRQPNTPSGTVRPSSVLLVRPAVVVAGARTKPFLVDSDTIGFSTSAATGASAAFKSLNVMIGDVITIGTNLEDNLYTDTPTKTAGTSTIGAFSKVTGTNTASNSKVSYWTTTVTGNGTLTVTVTITGGAPASAWWGASIRQWGNSDGIGASFSGLVQSNNLTEQQDNSTILANVSSWAATDPGTPTWNGGLVTTVSGRDTGGAHYSWALAKLDDAGTASVTNYGLATPTFGTPAMAMIEVLGRSSAITEDASAPAPVSGTGTTATTASFTPVRNALIVAVANVGNTTGSGTVTAPVTDSLSSTWTLLKRSNTGSGGSSEVWAMDAGSAPVARTVTVTGTGGANAIGVTLDVEVLTGTQPVAAVLGASVAQAVGTAYTVPITTTTVGSLVVGGLSRHITAVTLTPNGITTAWQAVSDAGNTEAYGAWRSTALTVTPGSTTFGYTNTAASGQVMTAVELLAAPAGGGGAPTEIPPIVSQYTGFF